MTRQLKHGGIYFIDYCLSSETKADKENVRCLHRKTTKFISSKKKDEVIKLSARKFKSIEIAVE